MARSLEMIFDARVRNAANVEKLENTIGKVAQSTNLSTGNLRSFNQVLAETATRTGGYSSALNELAKKSSIFQQFAKDVQAYVTEQDKAAAATQRWGRTMELAYQENAARDKKRVDDARKAADEIIKQQERTQASFGRIGARLGGTALGSAAGLPGLGRVSGTVLGSLGLSGGAMLGIGAAATGIFAGVEFTKSLDNLAKWAQQTKNAAAETGITVSEMQELSRVSERTGVNIAGAAKSVQDLSKEMVQGGGRAREIQSALSELGLKSSVAFEEPYKGLTDIQHALAAIKDPIERDRVAIELLGEAAGRAASATAGIARTKSFIDPSAMTELEHARQTMAEIGEKWDILKSKFATPLNAVLTVASGAFELSSIFDQGTRPSSVGGRSTGRLPGVLPGMDDLMPFQSPADAAAVRNAHALAWVAAHGTPEDRYRSTDETIASDQKRVRDQYQAGALTDSQFDSQMAAIEARKASAQSSRKSAEEFRSQVERFQTFQGEQSGPLDAAEMLRQMKELPRTFNRLGNYGPYQNYSGQLSANASSGFLDYAANRLIGRGPLFENKPERGQVSDVEDWLKDQKRQDEENRIRLEERRTQSQIQIQGITTDQRDTTEGNESRLRLQAAQMAGHRTLTARQNELSPTGVAQLDLDDAIKLIVAGYTAKAGPITTGISQLGNVVPADDKQKAEIDRQMENDRAQLQKLQNDALTQSVEAVDKFNESLQEASNKIKDEFGSFASGLVASARSGRAGTYSRNFLLGQSDKVVDNLAKSIYQPGMLSIPGQGTPASPTFLGTLLKGTMFAQDPKALQTVDNTNATIDNTKATLLLCSALGVDPSSLGISGSASAAVPFFGGASSSSTGLMGQVNAYAKALGINIPGASSSSPAGSSIGGPLGSILKLFGFGSGPSASSQPGWTGTAAPPPGGYNVSDDGSSAWSFSSAGQVPGFGGDTSGPSANFPALGVGGGDYLGNMGANSSTVGDLSTAQDRTVSSALSGGIAGGGSSSANPTALGMGFQAAGGAFGIYHGISEMTHGGAQNISGGIGSTLMGASSILAMIPGAQIAAPFVAAAGAVASLVSAFMGDPRANRAKQLTEEQIANTYTAPNPLNVTQNASGMITTTDYRGKVESLDALPSVSKTNAILGFNPYNTNQLISSSQWQLNPSGMVAPSSKSSSSGGTFIYSPNISTMDQKSFMDHGPQFADALIPVMQSNHRFNSEVQRVVNP